MGNAQYDFGYDIGDEVTIKEINRQARVIGLLKDSDGIMYRVVYWDDGERQVIYVYDWELK